MAGNLIIYIKAALFSLAAFCLLTVQLSYAQDPDGGRASFGKTTGVNKTLTFKVVPTSLADGSLITSITPSNWAYLGSRLTKTLVETHKRFSSEFGKLQPISTSLRILPENLFFQTTGAPYWTNALYYKGQIFIPMSNDKEKDDLNLIRSAKHEYVHAIISGLSSCRSPGWLDEGIAQWSEGDENPVLRPSLLKFLKRNPPIPLARLQGGFTKLGTDTVAPAYAQSLIVSVVIIKKFGFPAIRRYFDYLRSGEEAKLAFNAAFGISEAQFEDLISENLADWAAEI